MESFKSAIQNLEVNILDILASLSLLIRSYTIESIITI